MLVAMITPRQSKAARALLNWTQAQLAEQSGVKLGTIKDFESERHTLNSKALAALARAYQKAGLVLFFDGDGGGAGVRLKEASE